MIQTEIQITKPANFAMFGNGNYIETFCSKAEIVNGIYRIYLGISCDLESLYLMRFEPNRNFDFFVLSNSVYYDDVMGELYVTCKDNGVYPAHGVNVGRIYPIGEVVYTIHYAKNQFKNYNSCHIYDFTVDCKELYTKISGYTCDPLGVALDLVRRELVSEIEIKNMFNNIPIFKYNNTAEVYNEYFRITNGGVL